MASSILHIKDSYYFELPKFLARSDRADLNSFEDVWVRLDPDFQLWEAERLYAHYAARRPDTRPKSELLKEYVDWKHDSHANAGRHFSTFLEEHVDRAWFQQKLGDDPAFVKAWNAEKSTAGNVATYREEVAAGKAAKWSQSKIQAYNRHLDGKIIIPQPFGELRNLYEAESGFVISKFMIIELMVALVLVFLLSWFGRRVVTGQPPKGRLWNLLETFALYIRDQIARPAIDHHDAHDGHHAHEVHAHPHIEGHTSSDHVSEEIAATKIKHGAPHHAHEGDRFVPLLCTIFFFVLGCNLTGMLPWLGAPTGALGATFGLACVTFATVVVSGMRRFGFFGFFLNQIPGMDLPIYLAVLIKPLLFLIEMLGLLIKHLVLAVRLLANMVAGHVVLLGIMGIAFSLQGASSDWWVVTAPISLIGSTLLSLLELAVAFIQAYIFTFLSALFIGAAVHQH